MPTDAELRDQAVALLAKTTITYPAWVKGGRSKSSNWAKALALLTQIGAAPAPASLVIAPPQGTLAVHDGAQTADSFEFLNQWTTPSALAGGDIGGLDLRNYLSYGLGLMSWNPSSPNPLKWLIHDLKVSGTARKPPGSGNGTAEAGLWIGQQVEIARAVFGPGNAWMDIWTGAACAGSYLHDFECVAPSHVGVYHEHVSDGLLLERFRIGQGPSGQSNAINCEWWYGGVGSSKITWRAFDIYCPAGQTGIFLDAGTWGCVIGDDTPGAVKCRFWGPGDAIGLPNNLAGPTDNVVHTANISFENTGRQVYKHSNAIG